LSHTTALDSYLPTRNFGFQTSRKSLPGLTRPQLRVGLESGQQEGCGHVASTTRGCPCHAAAAARAPPRVARRRCCTSEPRLRRNGFCLGLGDALFSPMLPSLVHRLYHSDFGRRSRTGFAWRDILYDASMGRRKSLHVPLHVALRCAHPPTQFRWQQGNGELTALASEREHWQWLQHLDLAPRLRTSHRMPLDPQCAYCHLPQQGQPISEECGVGSGFLLQIPYIRLRARRWVLCEARYVFS
jgi:hypothetical protein